MAVTRSTARKLVVSAAVATAVVGILVTRSATASAPSTRVPVNPDPGTTSSEIMPSPAPGEEYWTPERMRSAKPAPGPPDAD